MDYTHIYKSPLGSITLGSDGEQIIGLWFANGRFFGETLSADAIQDDSPAVFHEADKWLDIYFSGNEPDFTPPLCVRGSTFRKRVCEIMLEIPYGRTVTYAEIARRIASERGIPRMSAQAVGGAVGHNPVSIIIPCHRIVGSDGSLTGYGGGIDRKIRLLTIEGADMTGFYVPDAHMHVSVPDRI